MLHAWSSTLCFFLPYWQKKFWSAGSVQHALACTMCFNLRAPPSTALCLCLHSRGEHSIRAGQPASKCNCMVEVWTPSMPDLAEKLLFQPATFSMPNHRWGIGHATTHSLFFFVSLLPLTIQGGTWCVLDVLHAWFLPNLLFQCGQSLQR